MQVQLAGVGKKSSAQSVDLSDDVFACEFNEPLIHQVVVAYQAAARAGTRAQKTRAEVRGGGKKPWKQKGTGRARAGSIRSPLWRKGGTIFAAKPQDHSQKVNRKMYRGAMRSILSELLRQERLHVVESFEVAEPKTKALIAKLKEHNLENALLLTDTDQINLYLASRNLKNTLALDVQDVDPVSLLRFEHVLITAPALKKLEEMLAL